jgi:hypothetical protein
VYVRNIGSALQEANTNAITGKGKPGEKTWVLVHN